MPDTFEITPSDAASQLAPGAGAVLIDVREPEEFALARLTGSQLVPMGTIPRELQRLEELADENSLFVLCHHGVRSLQVVAWLRERGIENCFSIAGGIDRWSQEVDPSVPRY
jgi:rhodanese-related sulfurtransferase